MLFSTPLFVLGFLPVVLLGYWVATLAARRSLAPRNAWLLAASLFFYWWGEQQVVLWMLAEIAVNWGCGLWIGRERARGRSGRAPLVLGVALDLALLGWFKYANFFVGGFVEGWAAIALPIGISFFTFQALSYLVDVYRGVAAVQRNPVDFALYIALFPQLIAGPIVRYHDIAVQLASRRVDLPLFASGARRFAIGLAKKLLVADTCAVVADAAFGTPTGELGAPLAWVGLLAYTAQIYFDFSGYSDMAIGLARLFGFRLRENFLWPYVSQSITEFWRRWHVSLSSWFRDYLYVPLGGNRRGASRTYLNLVLVFLLCGLWHGAAWTFVLWGAWHGLFLVVERVGWRGVLDRAPRPLRHAWTLAVVIAGWLLFRADSLPHAGGYLAALAGAGAPLDPVYQFRSVVTTETWVALAAAVVGSTPWLARLGAWRATLDGAPAARGRRVALDAVGAVALAGLWTLCLAWLAADTYSPFIYFRF